MSEKREERGERVRDDERATTLRERERQDSRLREEKGLRMRESYEREIVEGVNETEQE